MRSRRACHEEWVGETQGEEGERDRRRREGRNGERHQERQRRQQQRVTIEIVVQPGHPATGPSLPDEHISAVEEKPKLHLDFARRRQKHAVTPCEST